jgi:NADP-dependent 3-hydroxy acid dehydrogenase YdfG
MSTSDGESGLRDRTAVITGGGGGIGRATAVALAAAGARLVLADLDLASVSETADRIRGYGGAAMAVECDVTRFSDLESLRDQATSEFGRVDVVVANAGLDDINDFVDGDIDRWRRVVETNVLGLAYTIKAFLPLMRDQRSGHVVIMASQSGRITYAGEPIYIASKWAAVGLGGALRKEVASFGVRVSLIEPGLVDTPMTRATEAGRRELARGTPLQPEDVAAAVMHALTQPAHVNVHEIVVQPFDQEL